MEEQIQTIQPVEEPVEFQKSRPVLKYVLFGILGIVGVLGILYAGIAIGKKQTSPNSQLTTAPTVTPEVSPTSDPTANWKTYTNTEYGYEIKYPDDRQVYENPEGMETGRSPHNIYVSSITYPSTPSKTYRAEEVRVFTLRFYKNSQKLTLEKFITNTLALDNAHKSELTSKRYGNLQGILYTAQIMDEKTRKEFAVEKDDYVIQFTGIESEEGIQILSTFKFLDQGKEEVSDWETYTNSNFGFQIKHPVGLDLNEIKSGVILGTFEVSLVPSTVGFSGGVDDIQYGISFKSNSQNLTKEEYLEEITKNRVVVSKEEIIVNGIKGYRVIYDGEINAGMPEIYLSNEKYLVSSSVFCGSEGVKESAIRSFDQILSTFKFLD